LSGVISRAGEAAEVVLEATHGWYWAVNPLHAAGANVHLAHPLGVKAFEYRWVKNDFRDARDLADLMRMDRRPEVWIAPPATRELRELVRHLAMLVGVRSIAWSTSQRAIMRSSGEKCVQKLNNLDGTGLSGMVHVMHHLGGHRRKAN
jgi:transposase